MCVWIIDGPVKHVGLHDAWFALTVVVACKAVSSSFGRICQRLLRVVVSQATLTSMELSMCILQVWVQTSHLLQVSPTFPLWRSQHLGISVYVRLPGLLE